MAKRFLKELPELLKAGVLDEEDIKNIQDYYSGKFKQPPNRLFVVFGILGAILTGLGIILIIAHNWDELSRPVKTILSFLPLLTAQTLCMYAFLKRENNIAWKESTSTLLFFTVGACISLISQVYNIPGDFSSFMITWMLLCLPVVYLMRSSSVSLLYLVGISVYASKTGYFGFPSSEPYIYWVLLLIALPYYFNLRKKAPGSNFVIYHNWIISLSLIIVLGTVAKKHEDLMYIAYFSLFGLLHLLGTTDLFKSQKLRNNGFLLLGSLGSIFLLMMLSFDWFWKDLIRHHQFAPEGITSVEFIVSVLISLVAGILLYYQIKFRSLSKTDPLQFTFVVFIVLYIIGNFATVLPIILINIFVLILGVLNIRKGAVLNNLGILNYGLLIVTALVVCRFFDTNMSYFLRGILFVIVGAGFFAANYFMLRKRTEHER